MKLDPVILGRTLEAYLTQVGTPIAFRDRATSQTHSVSGLGMSTRRSIIRSRRRNCQRPRTY